MKTKIEYGLEGAFKADLYSGGKLVETTDWFSNFITQTGLMYPTIYNFVDCFRFLSLGSGATVNYGGVGPHAATTGLAIPIQSYQTNNGSQRATYIGWQGYETGGASQESACGTSLTESGPRFFRAWSIPTGDIGNVINEPLGFLNIQEFMVSPSSGSDPTGNLAFSRIVRNLSIPNGYRAIISYQLRINVKNTGITQFIPGTFQTGNADVTNDLELVSGWANLSGYYRQVFHGLECIDKNGAAYISKYGAGMEPAQVNLNSFAFYLSPDNSEFDVNGDGGAQTSEASAYAADGLMNHLQGIPMTLDRDVSSFDPTQLDALYYGPADIITNFPDVDTPRNIRLGGGGLAIEVPSVKNYSADSALGSFNYQTFQDATTQTISYATPGYRGIDISKANFGQKAVFSTRILKLPMIPTGQNLATGRKKTISRKTLFSPVSSLGFNSRFGSLVFAYSVDSTAQVGNRVYYPMMDCLFYDSSGRSLMNHYRLVDTIALTERGSGIANAYVFLTPYGENASRLTPRKTFQGPYNLAYASGIDTTHPVLANTQPSGAGGQIWSGQLKSSNIEGNVNLSVDGGSGWGAVYGIISDDGYWERPYDLGLAPHSLANRTAPSPTDTIYWPSIKAGNEIVLNFSGIEFYQPEIGLISTGAHVNFFSRTGQIIETINFADKDGSCLNGGLLTSMILNPTGFNSSNTPIASTEYGYYLTTQRFNQQQLQGGDETGFMYADVLASITKLSGVVIGGGNGVASCSNISTTPSKGLIFTLRTGAVNLPNDGFFGGVTNAIQVTGFFNSINERGYASGVSGVAIKPDEVLNFALTGRYAGSPLYLTYVWYSGSSRMSAHSYLSPTVKTSHFMKPTGYIHHQENIGDQGFRLLPLCGLPNNQRVDIYSPSQGGYYPGLSFDNGLELYFDITWSSPCGGAAECNQPV